MEENYNPFTEEQSAQQQWAVSGVYKAVESGSYSYPSCSQMGVMVIPEVVSINKNSNQSIVVSV
jgi:hypothetical protein